MKIIIMVTIALSLGACDKMENISALPSFEECASNEINADTVSHSITASTEETILVKPEGYDNIDVYEKFYADVRHTEEFKEVYDRYRRKFGHLAISFVPETETLGGFKEKVEKALQDGYNDIILESYNIQPIHKWGKSKRLQELEERMKKTFNYSFISEIYISSNPANISIDELEAIVEKSISDNKNYLKGDTLRRSNP